MAKPDLFDEIIECLKMQAILTPHTDVGEEILREFFTDAVKPVSVRQPSVAPGMQQRASALPVSKPFQAPPRQPSVPPVPSVRSVLPGQHSVLGDPSKMRWDEIAAAVASCQGCKLCRTRTNTVFGDGDPHAKLMFLGEAPGADEDLQGLPFVGRAGELLTRMINAMQFNRAQVFIANTVKCRPPNNRNPEPDETAACRPFILRQIELIQPEVIVMLGAVPLRLLFPEIAGGITRLRGHWMNYNGIRVMPTFHPAYLLRNPAAKADVWKDLQQVMGVFGKKHVAVRR